MKQELIKALDELAAHQATTREKAWQFKAGMYRKAGGAFKKHQGNITSFEQAEDVLQETFKDPKKIMAKVKEYFNTGKIGAVEKIRDDPIGKAILLIA